ncbi:hypothetical protein RHMOL_Rhmol06G0048300 [Rhododendron molle]|uniref:Uncharacterized protein n=1 Tax=Rhododendron molle TaxID=49168 RepID=A0ACC0N958_RHOML|nr:hypothetical protein RHMOL_Rhmol06G0048300 [Rhododendron molle]
MKPMEEFISYCPKEKRGCIRWVEKYFKDCLCNLNDEISFGLGLRHLQPRGLRSRASNEILVLMQLPTQFYTALLYTATTVVLVLQCIYYDHLLHWWKFRNNEVNLVKEESAPLKFNSVDPSRAAGNSPVQVPHQRKFYYT